MLLLALDTSAGLGVALHDGTRVLAARADADPRHHAERLAPLVREVLAATGHDRRDLTDVAVGVGPAPYTGLRVGVVTAIVLGETLGVPVHGVCSLDALAATALAGAGAAREELAGGFVVAADAKRREVHWARYGPTAPGDAVEALVRADGPHVGAPADVPGVGPGGWPCVGAGALAHPGALPGPRGVPAVPDPGALAGLAVHRLARGGELLPPAPLYLRRPDAAEPARPAPVRA